MPDLTPEARLKELLEKAQGMPGVAELMELYASRRSLLEVSDQYLRRMSQKPVFTVASGSQ